MSVSGTLSIIVAAIAVILGFLILRDINDSGDASGGGGDDTTETTATTQPGGPSNTGSTPDDSTPVTAPTLKPYVVIVANAAKQNGAAAAMTTALQGIQVATIPGVNSSVTAAEATTTIFYNPGYELEAADLAAKMQVAATAAMPSPPPIATDATLGSANLLVQLGTDKANQPLPAAGATAETTLAPTGT